MTRARLVLATFAAALPLSFTLPRLRGVELERRAPAVLAAFAERARPSAAGVATVEVEGRAVALATVVDEAGLLITKASELSGAPSCRLGDGRLLAARVLARDAHHDVALLEVDALDLTPVLWSEDEVAPGRLVCAPGPGGRALSVGIVGVAPQRIAARRGRLGVVLELADGGPTVTRVTPSSPAELAGLRVGDRILAIDGEGVADHNEAARRIRARRAGAEVRLELLREGERVELAATLAAADDENGRNARLEGQRSETRGGFPSALQHDCVLAPVECGGPLVGLDGRALGVNIARAGRVASYAIPAADLLETLDELKARAGR